MKQKENIFKNAYFGKPYKTRDERKALYWRRVNRNGEFIHYLILPNESGEPMSTEDEIIANKEGKNLNTSYTELSTDIVSEWQEEEISEEEYEEKFKSLYESCVYWQAYEDEPELFAKAFKELLDFAPSDKRTIGYCSDMIKSRKTIFNEVNKFITSSIRHKSEEITEEELDELAMIKYPCNCSPDEKYCDCCMNPDLKEAYKAGCKEMMKRL